MTAHDHSEGIHLQSERVVRAFKALREAPRNSDFKSDDFPMGKYIALVDEIKRLDGWLEPITATATTAKRRPSESERDARVSKRPRVSFRRQDHRLRWAESALPTD